jgi:hypothetical protein
MNEIRPVSVNPAYGVDRQGVLYRIINGPNSKKPVPRVIKLHLNNARYWEAHLWKNKICTAVSIHVLVLTAFVSPRPSGMVACHNNGNRSDNRVENLRWDTLASNSADRYLHGTMVWGEGMHNSRLTESAAREILSVPKSAQASRDLANKFGVVPGAIYNVWARRTWMNVAEPDKPA